MFLNIGRKAAVNQLLHTNCAALPQLAVRPQPHNRRGRRGVTIVLINAAAASRLRPPSKAAKMRPGVCLLPYKGLERRLNNVVGKPWGIASETFPPPVVSSTSDS